MSDLLDLKTLALSQHEDRGRILADELWTRCGDINGSSEAYKEITEHINSITKRLNTTMLNIDLVLSDDEMTSFTVECMKAQITAKNQREVEIEISNRPTNTFFENNKITHGPINYNKKAIINLTQCLIPEDICIALSYGPKFLFPFNTSNENVYQIIAQLDNCLEDSVNPIKQQQTSMEITRELIKRDNFQHDPIKCWLSFINHRTSDFLKLNEDILVTKSDKGGHVVVLYIDMYDCAINEMISTGDYELVNMDPLVFIKQRELKLITICKTNHKCKSLTSELRGYQPNTLQLARFYGLPKVHKPGLKLRPITSMIGAPGHTLGRVFNKMLNNIFPISEHHLKNSYEAKKFFDGVTFPSNFISKSYDVVNMFSNIPTVLAKEIVLSRQEEFYNRFGIGRLILLSILDFLLDECTVFMVKEDIYKQKRGLPMGGCISPTIARLVMDKVIDHLLNIVPSIAFIKVYVDDTFAVIDPVTTDLIFETLNNFHQDIKFTVEAENENFAINFLNLTVQRSEQKLYTNWYRKTFASGRLVPYFSSHKRTTILATAEAFIKTVLLLSDPRFFHTNKNEVILTLSINGFPDTLIDTLMNKYYTLMRPSVGRRENKKEVSYKIFPHATCKSRNIKKILLDHVENNVVLADSTKNTKINQVRTRKSPIHWRHKTNLILISRCTCEEKFKIQATTFNQTGEMLRVKMITERTKCHNGQHAFRKTIVHRGLAYGKQTTYLLKYLKMFFAGKTIDDKLFLPNYHLAKAMKYATIPPSIKRAFGTLKK